MDTSDTSDKISGLLSRSMEFLRLIGRLEIVPWRRLQEMLRGLCGADTDTRINSSSIHSTRTTKSDVNA